MRLLSGRQPEYNRSMGDELILAVLGMGFSAFCIWLTVRIVARRERWAIWTAIWLVNGVGVLGSLWCILFYHFELESRRFRPARTAMLERYENVWTAVFVAFVFAFLVTLIIYSRQRGRRSGQ